MTQITPITADCETRRVVGKGPSYGERLFRQTEADARAIEELKKL